MTRLCKKGHELTAENIYIRPNDGYEECRQCKRERRPWYTGRGDAWRKEITHCPQGHEYNKNNTRVDTNGHRRCKICQKLRAARAALKIKEEVLSWYSKGVPKCQCCGSKYLPHLTIDHIDGGGGQERK